MSIYRFDIYSYFVLWLFAKSLDDVVHYMEFIYSTHTEFISVPSIEKVLCFSGAGNTQKKRSYFKDILTWFLGCNSFLVVFIRFKSYVKPTLSLDHLLFKTDDGMFNFLRLPVVGHTTLDLISNYLWNLIYFYNSHLVGIISNILKLFITDIIYK